MNAERKWTPGPWETGDLDAAGQRMVRQEHIEICTCWHHSVGSIEKEMEANARLIAAAPDMYEALQEALELAELATELTGCRGDDDYVWGLRDKLKAVLSKANGAAS